jgi:hypothetical protein
VTDGVAPIAGGGGRCQFADASGIDSLSSALAFAPTVTIYCVSPVDTIRGARLRDVMRCRACSAGNAHAPRDNPSHFAHARDAVRIGHEAGKDARERAAPVTGATRARITANRAADCGDHALGPSPHSLK